MQGLHEGHSVSGSVKHVTDEKKYVDVAVHLEKDCVCKHNAISFLSEMFSK